MRDEPRFGGFDETPIYTMKTVVQQTGITPTTVRAWERRYGILQPGRSDGGYRLFSDQDIALLRWLKDQVESGVNIGRAVALLEKRRRDTEAGSAPAARFRASPEPEPARAPQSNARGTDAMVGDLLTALLAFCETRATATLAEAFALYPVEVVTENVIVASLVQVDERWHQGRASVVQANFVSTFLRERLTAMFTAYSQPVSGPLAVTGSAPGEWHDIGILLLALALRRQGWRVIHLGQNVPAAQLIADLPQIRPELVCLSATTPESARQLLTTAAEINTHPAPGPRFLFGGQAFDLHPELRERCPDAYMGATIGEALARLA